MYFYTAQAKLKKNYLIQNSTMPAPTKSNPAMSPDGGAPQPAVPKTELQELQMKAGEVTDEVRYVYLYSQVYYH